MRTLLVILAIIIAVVVIKRLITTRSRSKNGHQSRPVNYQKTVRCKHCGFHIPESAALKVDNQFYCSQNHYLEEKKKT
jgi:uncharacterized protein